MYISCKQVGFYEVGGLSPGNICYSSDIISERGRNHVCVILVHVILFALIRQSVVSGEFEIFPT